MEQEHTPAEIRPNRTVYRFTSKETIEALRQWLARQGKNVPVGEMFVWLADTHTRDTYWTVTLGVDHDDPPPQAKGGAS